MISIFFRETLFLERSKARRFCVLLDGFDELKQEYRNVISKQIMKMSDKYTDNYYIVSSRPDKNFVTRNNFLEMTINPLTKIQCLLLSG